MPNLRSFCSPSYVGGASLDSFTSVWSSEIRSSEIDTLNGAGLTLAVEGTTLKARDILGIVQRVDLASL